jgi:hypothetical protein
MSQWGDVMAVRERNHTIGTVVTVTVQLT